MRMVSWMCGNKLKERVPSKELRNILRNILGTTAKQVATVWPCAARKRQ